MMYFVYYYDAHGSPSLTIAPYGLTGSSEDRDSGIEEWKGQIYLQCLH